MLDRISILVHVVKVMGMDELHNSQWFFAVFMFNEMLIEIIEFGQLLQKISRGQNLKCNNEKKQFFHLLNIRQKDIQFIGNILFL